MQKISDTPLPGRFSIIVSGTNLRGFGDVANLATDLRGITIDLCNKFRESLETARKPKHDGRITRNSASGCWSMFRGFLKILYCNGMIRTNVSNFLEKIEAKDVVKEYLSVKEL